MAPSDAETRHIEPVPAANRATTGRSAAEPEHEIKFVLPAAAATFARHLVAAMCLPDRRFPPARVVTVYLDTPQLDLLAEKIDSDYLKTKVRLRWYAALGGGALEGPVFAEVKHRTGAGRAKVRVPTGAAARDIERWRLTGSSWKALLAGSGLRDLVLDADLAPVLRLHYRRDRYVDRQGNRFAVDSDITVDAVNPARIPGLPALGRLPTVVFEYKGRRADLPPPLAPITRLGARRASYSKYLACYDHAARVLG